MIPSIRQDVYVLKPFSTFEQNDGIIVFDYLISKYTEQLKLMFVILPNMYIKSNMLV